MFNNSGMVVPAFTKKATADKLGEKRRRLPIKRIITIEA